MDKLTISQVSKCYDVTPRMLRYYEKLGLIASARRENYAYRVYDEEAVRRLRQIIVLRKLRIPLKHIAAILNDQSGENALRILQDNLSALDSEISSLEKVREILSSFLSRLDESVRKSISPDLLSDDTLTGIADTLTLSKSTLKEKYTMSELDQANEILAKTENVRILHIPPCTVVSYHCICEEPEAKASDMMTAFIQKTGLYEIKPDARLFGFNHPNPGVLENGLHGYEFWLTIPDDMEIEAPYVKKRFDGGLYAALTMRMPEFERWNDLTNWVRTNEKFAEDYSPEGFKIMSGCLEEHLNWIYDAHCGWPDDGISENQLDLLLPVKRREL